VKELAWLAAVMVAVSLGTAAGGPPEPGPPVATQDPPPASQVLTAVLWLERPDAQDFERHYPRRAYNDRISGRATLDCIVAADGRLNCTVASEEPLDQGFGVASVELSRYFRMAPVTRDGHPTEGGRARVPIRWMIG